MRYCGVQAPGCHNQDTYFLIPGFGCSIPLYRCVYGPTAVNSSVPSLASSRPGLVSSACCPDVPRLLLIQVCIRAAVFLVYCSQYRHATIRLAILVSSPSRGPAHTNNSRCKKMAVGHECVYSRRRPQRPRARRRLVGVSSAGLSTCTASVRLGDGTVLRPGVQALKR